ncbi:YhcN/YlaJ family sporulation lipoprotein [Thermincola ferriacetica]
MQDTRKKIIAFVLSGMLAFSVFGGCTAQRKPLPPDANRAPSPTPAPGPTAPKTPEETRDAVNDLETKADTVPGVKKAYVVVVGNVALVGLNIQGAKQEKGTDTIKAKVTRVVEADRRIVKAYVTADPDMLARIREISAGVRQGKPITEFLDEISEMINRLAPSGQRTPNRPAL